MTDKDFTFKQSQDLDKRLIEMTGTRPQEYDYKNSLGPPSSEIQTEQSNKLKHPPLQSQESLKNVQPAKHVLYDQAIGGAVTWGISNFFYGIMSSHDFATTCLQFTGFYFVCLGFRFKDLYQQRQSECSKLELIRQVFLKDYYDPHNPQMKFNFDNLLHLFLRSLNFFLLAWLTIISAHLATNAQINFGIIASCGCISTPFNCMFSYFFWGEKLTYKIIIGTMVIISGVIWVSLAKGKDDGPAPAGTDFSEEEKFMYKILAVCTALFVGFLNSLRTLQAKYVSKKYNYNAVNFSIDGGLFCGIVLSVLSFIFYLEDHPTYSTYNVLTSFAASSLLMICSVMGLNALVYGLAGPTSAILSTQSIVQTILNAIILGLVPTLMQATGSLIAIGGVALIMLWK